MGENCSMILNKKLFYILCLTVSLLVILYVFQIYALTFSSIIANFVSEGFGLSESIGFGVKENSFFVAFRKVVEDEIGNEKIFYSYRTFNFFSHYLFILVMTWGLIAYSRFDKLKSKYFLKGFLIITIFFISKIIIAWMAELCVPPKGIAVKDYDQTYTSVMIYKLDKMFNAYGSIAIRPTFVVISWLISANLFRENSFKRYNLFK